jgi:hypothetical protein
VFLLKTVVGQFVSSADDISTPLVRYTKETGLEVELIAIGMDRVYIDILHTAHGSACPQSYPGQPNNMSGL